jgi:hypothetical protein
MFRLEDSEERTTGLKSLSDRETVGHTFPLSGEGPA